MKSAAVTAEALRKVKEKLDGPRKKREFKEKEIKDDSTDKDIMRTTNLPDLNDEKVWYKNEDIG